MIKNELDAVIKKCNGACDGKRIKYKDGVILVKQYSSEIKTCIGLCMFSKNKKMCSQIDCTNEFGNVYFEFVGGTKCKKIKKK